MSPKYEITDETRVVEGVTVHRIRALRDVMYDVPAGTLGGWVSSEGNLSQDGGCWLYQEATAMKNARVREEALARHNTIVTDDAALGGNARMSHRARLSGYALATGNARLSAYAHVSEGAEMYDSACARDYTRIGGEAMLSGTVEVCGDAIIGGLTSLSSGKIMHNAVINKTSHVVTLGGITDGLITVYRAPVALGFHVAVAGCQYFNLSESPEWFESRASRYGWTLPAGWKSLQHLLLGIVQTWIKEETNNGS